MTTTNKTKILIVDDDVSLSRLVQAMLTNTRLYEVKVENRSRQALAVVNEFRPDLILLDVDMPGMDGGDVARQVRADDSVRETPIIFFTSLLTQGESGKELVDRGGDHFLAKPIDAPILIRCIESLLGSVAAR